MYKIYLPKKWKRYLVFDIDEIDPRYISNLKNMKNLCLNLSLYEKFQNNGYELMKIYNIIEKYGDDREDALFCLFSNEGKYDSVRERDYDYDCELENQGKYIHLSYDDIEMEDLASKLEDNTENEG